MDITICWDQWCSEVARVLTLRGAEVICHLTTIDSEPADCSLDSSGQWRRPMPGHAAADVIPFVALNRTNTERVGDGEITIYGTSFITDHAGAVSAELDRATEGFVLSTGDLDVIEPDRRALEFFRDRRPDL